MYMKKWVMVSIVVLFIISGIRYAVYKREQNLSLQQSKDRFDSSIQMSDNGVPSGYSSEIIQVKFREGTNVEDPWTLLPSHLRDSTTSVTSLSTLSEEQLNKIGAWPYLWFRITLKPGTDAAKFMKELRSLGNVKEAQFAPLPAPPR